MTSKNRTRKNAGIHLNRNQRKQIRKQLVKVFGTRCCWCGGEMEIPSKGKNIKNLKNLATIEHYFAKAMNDPNNLMLLRLAHERCNK